MAELVIIEGSQQDLVCPLRDQNRVGHAKTCTITLEDRRVPEEAFEIIKGDRGWVLHSFDLQRKAQVNGREVEKTLLRHGDVIRVGGVQLLFSDESEETRARRDLFRSVAASLEVQSSIQSTAHHPDVESILGTIDPKRIDQRLTAMLKVAASTQNISDPKQLCQILLDILFREVPAESGCVHVRDLGTGKFRIVARKSREAEGNPSPRLSRTIVQTVLEKRAGVLSFDAMQDDRFEQKGSISEQMIRSALCVPMLGQNDVTGIIQLTNTASNAFSEKDLSLVGAVALPAGLALHNALTHQQRLSYSDTLKQLELATQDLSAYLEVDKVTKEAVGVAQAILKADQVSLILHDPDKDCLRIARATRVPREVWKDPIPIEGTLCGKVYREARPLLVPDPTTGQLPPGVVLTQRPRYRRDSFLIVPIVSRRSRLTLGPTVAGVLCVTDKYFKLDFTSHDMEVLTLLASQVRIALANADLYEKATVDALTRVFARRHFLQLLEVGWRDASSSGQPLCFFMLDLDRFKDKNDAYGHPAGDRILSDIGMLLKSGTREGDRVGRYGGEEFCAMLPNTSREEALAVSERIRQLVSEHTFLPEGPRVSMTVSIGVAQLAEGEKPEALIQRADQALYKAKQGGRNRVEQC